MAGGVYRKAWTARPRRKVVGTHAAGHVVVRRRRPALWRRWAGWLVRRWRRGVVAAGTPALVVTGEGLEHTLPDARLHHALPASRLHHTPPDARLHHTVPGEARP